MNRRAEGVNPLRIAVVGAGTLKGKELADEIGESALASAEVRLLDDDESLGQLEAVGEEPTVVQAVSIDNFEHVDVAFFASEAGFTRRHWELAKRAGNAVVDLSYGLEDAPGVQVRAPWVEHELGETMAPELQPTPVVVAHPAATVLGVLLLRAQRAGKVQSAVATVLEPASERGRSGMDELHEQTVNLLSFQKLPQEVYDAQVAFNLVARYGEKSGTTLESAERRMADHLRRITNGQAPVPALVLVQAPTFHGHAFSIYIELEKPTALGDFSNALAGEHVTLTRLAEDSPSNVSAAGQGEILIAVRRDADHDTGFWIWATVDNLKVAALNAIACAERIMASKPRGSLQ